jgi:hypothetical protein
MSDSPAPQLSLRGFDQKLDRAIRELARSEKISRNRAALILLRRGAGLEEREAATKPKRKTIGTALDRFFGTWSKKEAEEFDKATSVFAQIDADMWK